MLVLAEARNKRVVESEAAADAAQADATETDARSTQTTATETSPEHRYHSHRDQRPEHPDHSHRDQPGAPIPQPPRPTPGAPQPPRPGPGRPKSQPPRPMPGAHKVLPRARAPLPAQVPHGRRTGSHNRSHSQRARTTRLLAQDQQNSNGKHADNCQFLYIHKIPPTIVIALLMDKKANAQKTRKDVC